jgi:phosphoribosylanthranilate isomerase
MAFKQVKELDYKLKFIAGDTEYVRLTIKDEDGNVIDVSTGVEVKMGIKKRREDVDFLIPEKIATVYVYHPDNQKYTIEFKFDSMIL